jgi:hypothetical protein
MEQLVKQSYGTGSNVDSVRHRFKNEASVCGWCCAQLAITALRVVLKGPSRAVVYCEKLF